MENFSKDNFLTSMSEFTVQKISERHREPTKRILCLTEATILERDPQTYSVCYLSFFLFFFFCIKGKKMCFLFFTDLYIEAIRRYFRID